MPPARANRPNRLGLAAGALVLVIAAPPADALDRVTLATNWRAQPELGGFYQAVADGTYRRHGLEVTIRPGGPLVNNRPLLPTGRVDFLIATNLLQPFAAAKRGIPTRAVAAVFQRDPQCLLAHPGQGYRRWADLPRAPLLMSNSGRYSFFMWMEAAHGFRRKNLRPYNHSLAPFLARKSWIMQGYATAEPHRVAEELGDKPLVFLLADHGWNSYSTLIETTDKLIDEQPDLVQRFVDASLKGWRNYLDGDAAAVRDANAAITKANPSMTAGLIGYSRREMRRRGLIDSPDTAELGLGALRAERVVSFFDKMVAAGVYRPSGLDPRAAINTRFVNRGVARRPGGAPPAADRPGAPAGG